MEELKLSNKPFPLASFLAIYLKANSECYKNSMQGSIELYNYLTSEGRVPLELPAETSLDIVPRMLVSYELNELTKILTSGGYQGKEFFRIRNIIYKTIARS